MTLQNIIDRNNATLAFLQQQDFHSAVLSSSAAMALLQEEFVERNNPAAFLSTITADDSASDSDYLDQCMLLVHVNTSISSDDLYHDDTPAFVYDLGIAIPPTATGGIQYEAIAAILIFNTALTHQLYAHQLQDKSASQGYLLKSKRLYDLALVAYGDEDHNVLFQFAVTNNIAVIELATGNATLSTEYFENLLSVFMLLVDQGCSSRLRHLQGFLRNVPSQVVQSASAA